MSKRAKLTIWACAILIALTTLGAVVCILWPFLSSSDINSEIAKLKRQGVPVSEKDLTSPKPPDSQNAAVLYDKAFDLMPRDWEGMRQVSAFLREENREYPDVWTGARALVGRCEKALALAEEASRRPACSFGVESRGATRGWNHHVSGLRSLVRLACARAIMNAHDGKAAKAANDLQLAIACAQALRTERSLSTYMARVAGLRTISTAVQGCLAYGSIPDVNSREICAALGRIDFDRDFRDALEGERATTISQFNMSAREGFGWLSSGDPKSPQTKIGNSAAGRQLQRAIVRIDERFYLREVAKQMRIARLPYYEIERQKLDKDPVAGAPKYGVLSTLKLPMVQRGVPVRDLGLVSVAACRALLGLQVYHDRFHEYPASLDELRSKLGWRVEADAFSGKDLVYKRLPKGYLLYSIGANLKDDGGTVRDYFRGRRWTGPSRRSGRDYGGFMPSEAWRQEGDIVWRMERAQRQS